MEKDGTRKQHVPKILSWRNTRTAAVLEARVDKSEHARHAASLVVQGRSFTLEGGDVASVSSDVVVRLAGQEKPVVARILEVLVKFDNTFPDKLASQITVRTYEFLPSLHHILRLPRLLLTDKEDVVRPCDVLAVVNLQHDCYASGCTKQQTVPVLQERQRSTKTRSVVTHMDTNSWILNTHSIHNHEIIKQAVPPELSVFHRVVAEADVARVRAQAVASMKEKAKKAVKDSATTGATLASASGSAPPAPASARASSTTSTRASTSAPACASMSARTSTSARASTSASARASTITSARASTPASARASIPASAHASMSTCAPAPLAHPPAPPAQPRAPPA
ncbi:hypothetical protein C8Q77DRAFT_153458, partial [Trametes polyzona]